MSLSSRFCSITVAHNQLFLVPFSCFFFQAEAGIRDTSVTGVQTCALRIWRSKASSLSLLTCGWSGPLKSAAAQPQVSRLRELALERRFGQPPPLDASGYDRAAFIPEFYDHVVPYASRPDIGFYVETARQHGGPVLELGCGTGRILIPTARAGININ